MLCLYCILPRESGLAQVINIVKWITIFFFQKHTGNKSKHRNSFFLLAIWSVFIGSISLLGDKSKIPLLPLPQAILSEGWAFEISYRLGYCDPCYCNKKWKERGLFLLAISFGIWNYKLLHILLCHFGHEQIYFKAGTYLFQQNPSKTTDSL